MARDLKYRTHETDFGALARELHGGSEGSPPDADLDDELDDQDDEWGGYDPALRSERD